MVKIELPAEEADALHIFLSKVHYEYVAKTLRRENWPKVRHIEDVAWSAIMITRAQLKNGNL